MTLMQLIWKADASVNVCPSIHCQSSACMAIAFSGSTLARKDRQWLKVLAFGWAALICASTVFTKQHSIIDVFCGLAVALVWVPVLYLRPRKALSFSDKICRFLLSSALDGTAARGYNGGS